MTQHDLPELAEGETPPTDDGLASPETGAVPADGTPPAEPAETGADTAPQARDEAEIDRPAGDEPAEGAGKRPANVPEKFWDAERGEVRLEALLKSYAELERRLTRSLPLPADAEDEAAVRRLRQALGWPEDPEGYEIEPGHPALEVDPELNRRLHEAGFTREQAQLVYDLAAERLLPAIDAVAESFAAERERERLIEHFGGAEAFETVARQLRSWAEAHLDPEVYESLAGSYQGVLALHRMMQADEPAVIGEPGSGSGELGEDQLYQMMRDPRYWRDRDPEFVARVTEGFRRLYGE